MLSKAKSPREVASVVRTAALLDRLNLGWTEHEDKSQRLDSGEPTDILLVIKFDSPQAKD